MTENYAKEFHEATGGCWHEWITGVSPEIYLIVCKHCGETYTDYNDNPTYSHADEILNRMRDYCGEERYFDFMVHLGSDVIEKTNPTPIGLINNFLNDYILDPPALLKKAVEFLKGDG